MADTQKTTVREAGEEFVKALENAVKSENQTKLAEKLDQVKKAIGELDMKISRNSKLANWRVRNRV